MKNEMTVNKIPTRQDHHTWLKDLAPALPEVPADPEDTARMEADHYMRTHPLSGTITVVRGEMEEEAYELSKTPDGWRVAGGRTGVLYGTYTLLFSLSAHPLSSSESICPSDPFGDKFHPDAENLPPCTGGTGVQKPFYSLRMLNCWDNMDGSIERGYAGRSLWFENNAFSYDPDRIRLLGRLLASTGINVLCLNNVNVHAPAQELIGEFLPQTAAFADLLRPFAVRLMISIDFSMPLQKGLPTADPLDPDVQNFWEETSRKVYSAIPDLAGFLVKADSEHRPGPHTYGRSHAEGANMLAKAVKPFSGVLVWRAFVYNCMQDWRDTSTDRPCAAFDLYHPLDGCFDDHVLLQVKYGPYDFQVREPISPLLLGMKRTNLALELQLAQEYTGQQIDIFAMPPMWREIFDTMGKGSVQAAAAVSNLGRDACLTGHPFALLNLFAYGQFAWNPEADPSNVIRRWVCLTWDLNAAQADTLTQLLLQSRRVYEKYTSPLGLCWMVRPESHYGPSPYGYEFQAWGTYNRADRNAVGIDRTKKGTGYVCQYPPSMQAVYEDPASCPDELLLFFHRLPYTFRMKDGRTLIQRIYDDHFEGCEEAGAMAKVLEQLPLPEPDRALILSRMKAQLANAREWRDVVNTFFYRFCGSEDEKGRKIYP